MTINNNTYPDTHQQLFDMAIQEALGGIGEMSGRIAQDSQELLEWAKQYSSMHNLVLDQTPFRVYLVWP